MSLDHTNTSTPKRGRGRPPKLDGTARVPLSGSNVTTFLPLAAVAKIDEAVRRQGGGKADLLRLALFRGLIASRIISRADCEFLP